MLQGDYVKDSAELVCVPNPVLLEPNLFPLVGVRRQSCGALWTGSRGCPSTSRAW